MTLKEAKDNHKLFYDGKFCEIHQSTVRYTSNRSCKQCHLESQKTNIIYIRKRKNSVRYHKDNYNSNTVYRAASLLKTARKNAKERGLPFSLTKDFILDKIDAGVCEVSGIPFELAPNTYSKDQHNPFAPSLDKKVPELGYTKDNTRVVVWIYNMAKGPWPEEVVIKLANGLLERR